MNNAHSAVKQQRHLERRTAHELSLQQKTEDFLRTKYGAHLECAKAFVARDMQILETAKDKLTVVNWHVIANSLGVRVDHNYERFLRRNDEIRAAYLACHPEAMYKCIYLMDDWESAIQQASVVAILDGKTTLIWEIR